MESILDWSLETSVEPTVEPVSISDAKRNCDVDRDDRDADFARWIKEARKQVERDTRRSLINQTLILRLDRFPPGNCDYIELRRPPLSSVSSVQYVDTAGTTQTWDSSNYDVDTNRTPGGVFLAYNASWPDTRGGSASVGSGQQRNAVTITYVAGYGAAASNVPESAINAILYLVKHRWENPDWYATERLMEVDQTYQAIIGGLRWKGYE